MEHPEPTGADRDQVMDRLLGLVYQELHQIARSFVRGDRAAQTLSPTVLVHEFFLRLMKGAKPFSNRQAFFAFAHMVMKNILIDRRRYEQAVKREGVGVPISEFPGGDIIDRRTLVDHTFSVMEALAKLKAHSRRAARVAEYRILLGLNNEEIVSMLKEGFESVSLSTVKRDWNLAKAWIYRHLDER
ncbi:ECF-type sigma factor [Acanthopleuribacter pedis]|uniref:RNA polymerase sigma-70 ECF-like HTH domain-containing protein n=1 Tax=Acanthopleuribacter pedis TaxID=442870 RepID=A0A8J7QBT2_9BACT|nr:ECF-type sigma factor [Acanthopleuribacter pedis]MBO1321219.1 hypothetical protein [Acanthopleuribacter pedis]